MIFADKRPGTIKLREGLLFVYSPTAYLYVQLKQLPQTSEMGIQTSCLQPLHQFIYPMMMK